MPTFDVYQRKEQPSETVPAQQMGYGAVSALDRAGQQAAKTIDYIGKVWDDAEFEAQYTTARNNLNAQMVAFTEDYKTLNIQPGADGDYYKAYNQKKVDYENRLNAIKSNASTLTNKRARDAYVQDAEQAHLRGKVMLEAAFRGKMIEHQQVELTRSGEMARRAYMGGDLTAKDAYRAQIARNFKAGFIDEEQKFKIEHEVDTAWQKDLILSIAAVDPLKADEMTKSGEFSEEEKRNLQKDIMSIQSHKTYTFELEQQTRYNTNFGTLSGKLTSGDSFVNVQNDIDESYNNAGLSKDMYSALSDANKSRHVDDAKRNTKVLSEFALEIEEFAAEYSATDLREGNISAKDFLAGKNGISARLTQAYGSGLMTKSDYQTLSQKLTSGGNMPQKVGAAMASETQALKSVNKTISAAFPAHVKDRNDAFAEYYMATQEKKMSGKEQKALLSDIIAKQKDKAIARNATLIKDYTSKEEVEKQNLPAGTLVRVGGKIFRVK